MKRRWISLVAAAALALGPLPAAPAGAAQRFEVGIIEPIPGTPVFGEVDLVAEVRGAEPAARVEFFYNDEKVGELTAPPFRLHFDVGQDNIERRFRVVAHGLSGASTFAELDLPAIAVHEELDLGLRQLYVTALRSGARVLSLRRDEFEVRDLKIPQRIVTFERGDVPFTTTVLLDASRSMRGDPLATALAGAFEFVGSLRDLDEASIVLFSDRILAATPFGSDPEELKQPLREVTGAGGSAILDHVFVAMTQLEQRQGRRVILLLSDGVDVESVLTARDLAEALHRSTAMLYWLRLPAGAPGTGHISAWRTLEDHRVQREELAALAQATGGRVLDLASARDTGRALAEVLEEIRGQYVLGYYPSIALRDGRWHDVDVRVDEGGVDLSVRRGYFDD